MEKYISVQSLLDNVQQIEQQELVRMVQKHGTNINGTYKIEFQRNFAISSYADYDDDPHDYIIKSVEYNAKQGLVIKAVEKNDISVKVILTPNLIFYGQMEYITNEIVCADIKKQIINNLDNPN